MTPRRSDLIGPALSNQLELNRGTPAAGFADAFLKQPRTVQRAALEQLADAAPTIDRLLAYLQRLEQALEART